VKRLELVNSRRVRENVMAALDPYLAGTRLAAARSVAPSTPASRWRRLESRRCTLRACATGAMNAFGALLPLRLRRSAAVNNKFRKTGSKRRRIFTCRGPCGATYGRDRHPSGERPRRRVNAQRAGRFPMRTRRIGVLPMTRVPSVIGKFALKVLINQDFIASW
jgi:hypothetical protein